MRYKRSERIVFMTQYLMNHPNKLIPLTFFVKKFKQAKSSISEDVQIIKNTFQKEKLGTVITTAGASGGVTYKPMMSKEEATEGSTVSINYVSGSSRKIETMVLSKRTLAENSNVLVVDDFMRAGGSINGVMNLMNEFKAHVKGVSVLVESKEVKQRLIEDYTSLVKLSDVDEYNQEFNVEPGNSLSKFS